MSSDPWSPTFSSSAGRRGLFREVEPFARGRMATEGVHEIYYEECGRADGRPSGPCRSPCDGLQPQP